MTACCPMIQRDAGVSSGTKTGTVALLGGRGLGDNLIEMVLAHNARRCGYHVTMYSDVLYPLAAWFPQHRMLPSLPPDRMDATLIGYDLILEPKLPQIPLAPPIQERWINYETMYRDDRTQVANMVAISGKVFNEEAPSAENDIVPPGHLQHRRFSQRVCLHPTSAELSKNWLPERFLRLAERLQKIGFTVFFIMTEQETEAWAQIINGLFPLKGFADVADCASFVYESGFFIGNDSGGGHLASCLGIPTVSIHGRKGKAVRWRPGWGAVEVVTPRINLVGSFLRQHYWKYFLSVGMVERSFFNLMKHL